MKKLKYEVFFFKQKTAYDMRISDWSSDVCSSDLFFAGGRQSRRDQGDRGAEGRSVIRQHAPFEHGRNRADHRHQAARYQLAAISARQRRRQDRKSVVWGKSVSVRVGLGGCRSIKNKLHSSNACRCYNTV